MRSGDTRKWVQRNHSLSTIACKVSLTTNNSRIIKSERSPRLNLGAPRPSPRSPPAEQCRRLSPHFGFCFTVTSEYGFLRCVGKMMESVSMFRLVYCSASSTSGGTTASIPLQFINGTSACTYELHILQSRRRGHAFHIFHVWAPYALGTPIRGRTV
ncbi:hypothetical protein EVAR_20755_1 [Eumeta japonica]|uniref:Uncharacterized protein n=1 Tax=Eumeta variegata TaxID=151549 RepID=A0A4C1VAI5_EUMVA|nr:hypothetical protein EVAR_20755_1 [Eumeta japonica]